MQFNQFFSQIDFFRAIESGHIACNYCFTNRFVYLRVSIAKSILAYAKNHVSKFVAVQIPHFAALGFAEVGRPLIRQEHLGSLGQQHVAARNNLFGAFPKLLAGTHDCPFIANNMLVNVKNTRLLALQVKHFSPTEISARVKALEYFFNHIEIGWLVHRPAHGGEILAMLHGSGTEFARFA